MEKNEWILKMYGMSGYRYNDTLTIMMKGKWIETFGFKLGQEYQVYCKNGKLIITLKI